MDFTTHYCIFLYPMYTIKRIRKTNGIHIEILKERDVV